MPATQDVMRRKRLRCALAAALAGVLAGGAVADDAGTAPDLALLPVLDLYERAVSYPELEVFAPRVLAGAKRAQDRAPEDAQAAAPGMLQGAGLAAWPRLYRDDTLAVTGSVSGTMAALKMWNNAFGPPPSLRAPDVPVNPGWGELFLEAGLTARYALTPALSAYGGLSYLETGTRGRDYDGNGNTYHGDTELVYAGLAWTTSATTFDVSYGQQEFTLGNGMLLWAGATNGAQRGATYLGPRAAWQRSVLGKVTSRDVVLQVFSLVPNEAPAEATDTRIEGINVDWTAGGPLRLGASYLHVPRSAISTRDGLDVADVRVRLHPLSALPELWLQGEYVWERGPNARANGWYAQLNYNAQDLPWKPLVALQWSRLSGDNPGTARWEGFDPLYYGNDNPNWYPGKIGSTLFDNTNLAVASVNLTFTPSERQVLELWWLAYRAVVANAPLVIPQPHAPPPQGGGVPAKPLATEIDVSWTLKFGKAVNINLIAAWALPGRGYQDLYENAGGHASPWWLIGTQLNVSY